MFVVSHACGPWQLPELRGVLIGGKRIKKGQDHMQQDKKEIIGVILVEKEHLAAL